MTINASSNTPYNIRTAAGSPSDAVAVTLTVTNNAVQGSNSTGTAAIDTGTGWVAGTVINVQINAGSTICGMGGAGGAGSNAGDAGVQAVDGSTGGHGINMQWPVTVINNGLIAGGGGGGGGGKNDGATAGGFAMAGAGGGGGAGGAGGAAGAAGTGQSAGGTAATAASAGGASTGGASGNGGFKGTGCTLRQADQISPNASHYGYGGDLGLSGGARNPLTSSFSGYAASFGGNPGSAGNAIKRNANTLTGKADGTYADANWKGTVG